MSYEKKKTHNKYQISIPTQKKYKHGCNLTIIGAILAHVKLVQIMERNKPVIVVTSKLLVSQEHHKTSIFLFIELNLNQI